MELNEEQIQIFGSVVTIKTKSNEEIKGLVHYLDDKIMIISIS